MGTKVVSFSFAGNGASDWIVIGQINPADVTEELVAFQLEGSFNGATVAFECCVAPGAMSPWSGPPITDASFTSEKVDNFQVASGCAIRAVCTGAGSPLPSITGYFRFQG